MGIIEFLTWMGLVLWFWIAAAVVVFGSLLLFFGLLRRILVNAVEEVGKKVRKGNGEGDKDK